MHGLLGYDRLHMEEFVTFENRHLTTANPFRLPPDSHANGFDVYIINYYIICTYIYIFNCIAHITR